MTPPDRRSRVRGSLLAGAIGDALGAPVEFDSIDAIRARFGPAGVTDLLPSSYGPPGLITDDTQMVLFTVEALVTPGDSLHAAYLRWLRTQETSAPPPGATGLAAQQWLYAARAPGNACLSGLRTGRANPGSKGCGTVMRSAPFGLVSRTPEAAATEAIEGSALTHGHPTAGVAAAGLAVLIHHLVHGAALTDAVQRAGSGEIADHGEGWVAEEALAMSVHCALAHPAPDEMREALLLAVDHSGDSDSTGAITGNILGALHGERAIPAAWVAAVEGRETIGGPGRPAGPGVTVRLLSQP